MIIVNAVFLLLVAFFLGACSMFGVEGTPPGMGYVAVGALLSSSLIFAMHLLVKGARVN